MIYGLKLHVERLEDGGDYHYLATSPDLPGLLVAGDSPEECIIMAPQVASALLTSMLEAGDPLPSHLEEVKDLPFQSSVLVEV